MPTRTAPSLADVEAARGRLTGRVRHTPVFSSDTLARRCGRPIFLKAENLQRTGAFKIRGAVNRIALLAPAERAAGVVAASAGNHGQAVAWAARELGIHATVFMPEDAPMTKVEATRAYGAETVLAGAGFEEALEACLASARQTGATFIHAFDDERVIAGQGTLGLELAEDLPDVGTFVVAVGGGGLAAGVSIALRALRPSTRIVGVQAGRSGKGTIADGIAVKRPGELTMAICNELLDDIVHVEDDEISEAITLLLERAKLVTEGAGAAPLAALLAGKVAGADDACALLSGGNIDPTLLLSVIRHGLTVGGRYFVFRTSLPDRPGALAEISMLIAAERGNIVSIEHRREGARAHVAEAEIECTVVTRDEEHVAAMTRTLTEHGYVIDRIR